jgi:guanylate kinase
MSNRKGIVLVLSAPSGAGKTTVLRGLMASVEDVRFSTSFTTRSPRPKELDGVDYYFVSEDEFRAKIERGEFLEWAQVHGCLYGTGRSETEAVCSSGLDILLDVDVQGASQVRKSMPEAVSVFMLPPSFEELRKRIQNRGVNDDPADVANRLRTARAEAAQYQDYDYVIINEVVDSSVELLRSILLAERARCHLLEAQVKPILESFE